MLYPKEWVIESYRGFRSRIQGFIGAAATFTPEEAKSIIASRPGSISIASHMTDLAIHRAQNAANAFQKTDDKYAKQLVDHTRKLLEKPKDANQAPFDLGNQLSKLTDALQNSSAMETAIANYKRAVSDTTLKDAEAAAKKANKQNEFKQDEFIQTQFNIAKAELEDAFKQQQEKEKAAVDKLFNDSDFVAQCPDPEKTKEAMKKALEATYTTRLETLNNDININQINHARRLEYEQQAQARLLFLTLIANNKRNSSTIADLNEPNKSELKSELSISYDGNEPFTNADISKLQSFYSYSGKSVKVSADAFSIESSMFGFGLTEQDILQVALLGKAKGWKKITMSVEHDDPKKVMELARKAGESALKAGFAPADISIKVKVIGENGQPSVQTKTLAELGIEPNRTKSLLNPGQNITQHYKKALQDNGQPPPSATPTSAAPAADSNATATATAAAAAPSAS